MQGQRIELSKAVPTLQSSYEALLIYETVEFSRGRVIGCCISLVKRLATSGYNANNEPNPTTICIKWWSISGIEIDR